MTRAKDISKIVTDADLSGTLDVTGEVTIQGDAKKLIFGASADSDMAHYADGQFAFRNTDAQGFTFYTGSGPTERMRITSGGNVGIGVTPKAWDSTFSALQVGGTGALRSDASANASDTVGVSQNAYYDSANSRWEYLVNDEASDYYQQSGSHYWRVAPSGSADAAITWTTAMVINNSGNVGIGTTSPDNNLHIHSDSITRLKITGSSGQGEDNGIKIFQNGVNTTIANADNGYMRFYTNNTERMHITSAGNVGIGTSSPADRLHIVGSNGATTRTSFQTASQLILENNSDTSIDISTGPTHSGYLNFHDTDAVQQGFIGYGHTNDIMRFGTAGSERMRLNSLGFLRQSNTSTYRGGGTTNYNEFNTNASGDGVLLGAISNASYIGGGLQIVAVRSNYTGMNLLEIYSGDAADREFRINGSGQVFADGAYSATGADYAEMFEWSDGNTTNEDRVGKTVVLDGNQIRLSTSSDAQSSIIGVVSARPVVLGDSQSEKWIGKYETDDFGRYIREEYTQTEWTEKDEDGTKLLKTYQTDLIPSDITVPSDAIVTSTEVDGVTPLTRRRLNSSYDPSQIYIPREQRKEFSPIGLVGKLKVRIGQTVGDRWIKMREISDTVHEYLVR